MTRSSLTRSITSWSVIFAAIRDQNARLLWTIETHAHADHITSAAQLIEHTGAQAGHTRRLRHPACRTAVAGWRRDHFGDETLTAIHTPGHTAGSMSFLWRDHVFTGDTLLIDGCGRTDFQSGSADALYTSITERLFTLPPETTVWPGHDYKGRTKSTIGHERTHNSRLAHRSRADFIALMDALHLPKPRRIDEAVPANLQLGVQHHAGADDSDAPRVAAGYAGDVTPELAWRWWQSGKGVVVDIRTNAEREWVGFVPDAPAVAWKQWPGMAMNPDFDAQIQALSAAHGGKPLLMLCRSGVRSIASAKRATELGGPPTTSSKASRATRTALPIAVPAAAGAIVACRGGRTDRRQSARQRQQEDRHVGGPGQRPHPRAPLLPAGDVTPDVGAAQHDERHRERVRQRADHAEHVANDHRRSEEGNASQLFSCAACAQRGKPSCFAIQSRGLRLS